jgi:hypothetical protein
MEEEIKKQNNKEEYISLFEAAKLCSYSEPYLRLRARAGKLKSIKLGKKWMTTSAWIKDYEARVAEWREANEARKAVPIAVLVSAPAELSGNLASDLPIIESEGVSVSSELKPVPARQNPAMPGRDFANEGDDFPILPSRRPLANFASGQIYPVPQQSKDAEAGHGEHLLWLSALVTGAVSALVLAFMAAGGDSLTDLAAKAERFSQANVSQATLSKTNTGEAGNEAVASGYEINLEDIKGEFSSDNLKGFVEEVARFINNLEISGW